MATQEETIALMRRCCEANLQGLELFGIYSQKEIAAAYNGIGPDSFPEELRERITRHLELFAPAALIHDLRFDDSDGGKLSFNQANAEFHDNCLTLAAQRYPWWRHPIRRMAAREVAHILYRCVKSSAGWQAWTDAFENNIKQKGLTP